MNGYRDIPAPMTAVSPSFDMAPHIRRETPLDLRNAAFCSTLPFGREMRYRRESDLSASNRKQHPAESKSGAMRPFHMVIAISMP